MKLLIDIPEHIYEHAKESSEDSRDEFDAMRAIANGTQQERKTQMLDESNFDVNQYEMDLQSAYDCGRASTQQRTGRWIKQNYGWNWQCSECGFVTPPSAKEIFTFCPKCGVKMEVEE